MRGFDSRAPPCLAALMTNAMLHVLDNHMCERSFTGQPVADDVLDSVIRAAWRGPSSVNGQQTSVIVVRDPARRARLAAIAGGQPWVAQAPVFIVVVVDFHKPWLALRRRGIEQQAHASVEGLVAGALDAGIVLGRLMVAAQSCGLGIVPIGGIRRDPLAVVDLLGLPKLTFPVNGVCLGHVAQPATKKPRLPLATFRHDEHYHEEGLSEAFDAYDGELLAHWKTAGRADGEAWTNSIADFYGKVYFPAVKAAVEAQGFRLDR